MDGREAQNSKKVTSRPTTTQSALQSTPPLLCTMQKIFRRTLLAERQAERRLAKRKEKNVKTWLKNNNEQTAYMKKQESLLKKTARVWRREDYELGSLAPKRDVGALKASYGTFDPQISQGPILYRPDMEDKLAPWGGKYLNLRERDRVVLLEGHDKGKVGKISKIDRSRAEVTVEGLNMIDIKIPDFYLTPDTPEQRTTLSREKPVPMSAIRLVHTLESIDEDGQKVKKDVIVKRLMHRDIFRRKHGVTTWERVIPGLNIVVPWPSGQNRGTGGGNERTPPKEDKAADTLRIDVEKKTFIPSLFQPPMPLTIIDELRNKYSIFRTRHEPEYIQAKEAEEEQKKEKLKMAKLMRTPLNDASRRERELRKAKGKGELTPAMLEKIGRAIAAKKQLSLKPEVEIEERAVEINV